MPASDLVSLALLDSVALDELRRLREIREAWEAYLGDHPMTLKVDPAGDYDDNVTLNYCRVFVDKGVAFLFGRMPEAQIEQARAAEELARIWRDSGGLLTLKQGATNGAIAGHAFWRIHDQGGGRPRILNLDPATVFPAWESDDYTNVYRYRLQWNGIDGAGKARVFRTLIDRSDDGLTWTILDQISTDREGTAGWKDLRDAVVWPWPFAPIVGCQNLPVPNAYFGEPDLTSDIIDLNHRLNALASNGMKIVRLFAHPRPWAKGVSPGGLDDVSPDQTAYLPGPNSELGALEFKSDLASTIQLYERLRQSLHELARVPEIATGKLENVGNLSGLALQILYQPLIEKTDDKRGTYGDAKSEIERRALAVARVAGYDELEISQGWDELLPEDPLAERQALLIDQQLGVSKKTILTRLGYDPDVEAEQSADEPNALAEAALGAFDAGGQGIGTE